MSDIFFRVDVKSITNFVSPIIGQIGADNWAVLCALAAYMDKEKKCHPSYSTLATVLGISPTSVSKRMNKLLSCTVNGEPLVTKKRTRRKGRWDATSYQIHTDIVSIF